MVAKVQKPWRARSSAVRRPNPLLAPVISTTVLLSFIQERYIAAVLDANDSGKQPRTRLFFYRRQICYLKLLGWVLRQVSYRMRRLLTGFRSSPALIPLG